MKHETRTRWALAVVVGALALGSWPATPALADGMRCGTHLISDGDTMLEVRNVCGVPDMTVQRVEKRVVSRYVQGQCLEGNRYVLCTTLVQETVDVQLDEWTYDFGPSSLVRFVTFEQGRLIRVATGSYGTKQT